MTDRQDPMIQALEDAGVRIVGTDTIVNGALDHFDRSVRFGERVIGLVDLTCIAVGPKGSAGEARLKRSLKATDFYEIPLDAGGLEAINAFRARRHEAESQALAHAPLDGLEVKTDGAGIVKDVARRDGTPIPSLLDDEEAPPAVGDDLEPDPTRSAITTLAEAVHLMSEDQAREADAIEAELADEALDFPARREVLRHRDVLFAEVTGLEPGDYVTESGVVRRDAVDAGVEWCDHSFRALVDGSPADGVIAALDAVAKLEAWCIRGMIAVEQVGAHRGIVLDALEWRLAEVLAEYADTEPWPGYAKETLGKIKAKLEAIVDAHKLDGSDHVAELGKLGVGVGRGIDAYFEHVERYETANKRRLSVLKAVKAATIKAAE